MAETKGTLDALVRMYAQASLSPSTKAAYRTHLRSYLDFCNIYGYNPVPASPWVVCQYMAHLAQRLKYKSVKQYVNIIRIIHRDCGYPDPLSNNAFATTVLKGIRRIKGDSVHRMLPMTVSILRRMRGRLDLTKSSNCTYWAACLIAFYGMFRLSSIFPPIAKKTTIGDVLLYKWGIVITFTYSKTVQFQQRQPFISLPWGSDPVLCPGRALIMAWKRAGPVATSDPLLPVASGKGPVALTRHEFTQTLSSLLATLELSGYSGHSFRRGGATHALACGVPAEIIKAQGDWQSIAYLDYIYANNSKRRGKFISAMMN